MGEESAIGYRLLSTPDGQVLAILNGYCYVLPLREHRFLVWNSDYIKSQDEKGFIHLRMIDADRLRPISAPFPFTEMVGSGNRVYVLDGEIAYAIIPTNLDEGRHSIELPDVFGDLGEVLVLAHSTARGFDKRYLCLFVVRPRDRTVEVFPQDWYNNGEFDHGYEWPTRVARDPVTGKIFGEGVRIRSFVLDETCRQVETWL